MLSKLEYFKKRRDDAAPHRKYGVTTVFNELYRQKGYHTELLPGDLGTLGITFVCKGLPEGTKFVKTHIPGERYRKDLEKEYLLLKAAEGDRLGLQMVETSFNGEDQAYLMMDMLTENCEMTPDKIRQLIREYQSKLTDTAVAGLYDITDIHAAAVEELEVLSKKGFFCERVHETCSQDLDLLKNRFPDMERRLCHGDLGDRNIMMTYSGQTVVIDWEDTFNGCDGYDYLYWLTFFNHRKFYGSECLNGLQTEPNISRAITTMIHIVKDAISYYSGAYKTNSMTMEDRLLEAWGMWKSCG